ncbi:hypothetical protein OG884_18040 [Streptosporangium sp. NBC_01755]|uniref:hypothetical protein n=1 Tax=unclassified Streptosporangium TaxID=2632669 RepID=UPI002DD92CA2|nr:MULTISPECIES: hypothetical protein [unclassified Streptosporangium]WSA24961.1 hypothetical protein OIE13_29125 [Streptosporangium sp. NBC_01810]WSD03707.1 hypothetical protein OG884_18040 [Streptosporangium sp. NBC_01755]
MRRVAQRGGAAFALGLAVLGAVVLMHLALCVVAPAHSGHHRAPGPWLPATANADVSAAGDADAPTGRLTLIGAGTPAEHLPCPVPPVDEDHHLCGAAAGAQITGVRALVPAGPITGDPVVAEEAVTPPPPPARRRARPVRPPPGVALLLLKSVSRI